ncbi:MAG: hypothetical protein ACI4B3_09245 [Prevotella sp.]
MYDFQKFAIVLNEYLPDSENEKQMESFYEKIKDLECYDFRFFYYKAHYFYKKLGNIENAKFYIDKSIEAISSIKNIVK